MNRYISAFCVAMLLATLPIAAQAPDEGTDKHAHVAFAGSFEVEMFRQTLVDLLESYERAYSIGSEASDEVRRLDGDQMRLIYEGLNRDGRFLTTALRVLDRIEAAQLKLRSEAPIDVAKTQLFDPPDYPPASGGYNTRILDPLIQMGLTNSASSRCSNAAYGDDYNIWYPAQKLYESLESACVVAGCDPIGVVCAAACGVVGVNRAFAVAFAIPIELCDVHNGTVDGSEIQAAYENSVALFRTKVEENLMLSAPDFTIASLQIPEAFGGNLELVDSIVQEAMNNMIAAGGSINLAQPFFNQAQTHFANGQYKQAYLMYRRAYKEVVKLP